MSAGFAELEQVPVCVPLGVGDVSEYLLESSSSANPMMERWVLTDVAAREITPLSDT